MSTTISTNYAQIAQRIAQAASGRSITLLAVSKGQSAEAIAELYRLGHRDFGENYVQELVDKAEQLAALGCSEIRWHFIGHLQTNKVKALVSHVWAVHSVDSEKLARELAKRWDRATPLPCFIEVNIDGEASKTGIAPENTASLARKIASLPQLRLLGLMAVPASGRTTEETSQSFAKLCSLEEQCRPATQGQLSMGMSTDFELAITQGSTHVRVGTALFGPRKKSGQ